MPKTYWVYILTNEHETVLYVGVTSNIERRMREHSEGKFDGFTKKYNLKKLVYLEEFSDVDDAIYREKQLKNWNRSWKEDLISENNPDWASLFEATT